MKLGALDALLIVATLLNLYACVRHLRALRRLQARFPEMAKLVGFAAWASFEESGAPAHVRAAARAVLPPGTSIDVEPLPPESERVH